MKLYMVYVGGTAGKSNIEVHDVRFVVGNNIEDTFGQLKQDWYGNPDSLHLDCYKVIEQVNGFAVSLAKQPCDSGKKLYFVNLGGYQPDKMTELHEFGLFAASNANEAKQMAKQALLKGTQQTHKDDLYQVDDCLAVTLEDGWQIQLHADANFTEVTLKPDWFGYRPI